MTISSNQQLTLTVIEL